MAFIFYYKQNNIDIHETAAGLYLHIYTLTNRLHMQQYVLFMANIDKYTVTQPVVRQREHTTLVGISHENNYDYGTRTHYI